jgi:hypothetical protein
MSRKVKIIKKNLAPTAKPLGVNPMDPWSTKAGITEASEKELLHRFLDSRGINPEFVSRETKIAHSKSGEFMKWRKDHEFNEETIEEGIFTDGKPMAEENIPEAKTIQGTALDKFRQAAAERARKHDDIEREMKARHAAGKEDMKGSIDRLEKHLNKEEAGASKTKETQFHKKLDKLVHSTFGKRKDEMKMKEEVQHKVGDSVTVNSKFFGKQKGKVTKIDNQSIHVQRNDKKTSEKYPHDAVVKEDVYQDSQAATQTAFDMGTTPNQTEPTHSRRKEMSKSARIIKSIYKNKKMVKEEMYDHEKEDKSVQTYGKKPKMAATDKKDSFGEEKPDAAAIMSGGTTLTGEKRDNVEIDPMMRNKPGQNVFNKEFGKKGS